jgi:GMP synthase-like glutamine amidotransferase
MLVMLKHIRSEGPGTIGDFLEENSIPVRVVELGEGEDIQPFESYDVLVVMGGPMAVYDMDRFPFLKQSALLVEDAMKKGRRVLGICLGAQLIAHVLGYEVYKGGTEERGWLDIELTPEGVEDKVMGTLGEGSIKVLQWHGDTFDLPVSAVRLARSELYENQAFRYGQNVYGLQFHVEANERMIDDWFDGDPGIMRDTGKYFEEYAMRADSFYRSLLKNTISNV